MKIFELTPINEDSHHWRASTYRGRLVVRAKDERGARTVAFGAFGIAVECKPGAELAVNPWRLPELVECREVQDSVHDADGPAMVLEPRNSGGQPG